MEQPNLVGANQEMEIQRRGTHTRTLCVMILRDYVAKCACFVIVNVCQRI